MKKRSPMLTGVIFIIVVGLILLAAPLLDQWFAPWAFERPGQPALTGSWVGQFTTVSGQNRGVLLKILLPEPKGRRGFVRDWENAPYGEIGGTASFCDEQGKIHVYTIDGEPEDRLASHFVFYANPNETPAPNGLTVSWVNGSWDSAHGLTLSVQFYWEQDGSAITGPDYPDTQSEAIFTLTRGGNEEFEVICSHITGTG